MSVMCYVWCGNMTDRWLLKAKTKGGWLVRVGVYHERLSTQLLQVRISSRTVLAY
jgi:hypothetical protein